MKKFLAFFLSLLLVATMLVGMLIPAAADGAYTATFENKIYKASAENAEVAKTYFLTVSTDAPAEVKALIDYTVNGQPFNGASEPGVYTVTAHLPEGYFVDAAGKPLAELTATLTLVQNKQDLAVIVFDSTGKEADAYAELKEVTIPADLLKKAAASQVLSFEIKNGAETANYLLLISKHSDLEAVKSKGVSEKSVYLYEDGKLISPEEKGYKVELKDGRFEISNVPANAQMTLVIIAEKVVFPWWIIIIILVILLLICMYFVGRAKIKREGSATSANGDSASADANAADAPQAPKKE